MRVARRYVVPEERIDRIPGVAVSRFHPAGETTE